MPKKLIAALNLSSLRLRPAQFLPLVLSVLVSTIAAVGAADKQSISWPPANPNPPASNIPFELNGIRLGSSLEAVKERTDLKFSDPLESKAFPQSIYITCDDCQHFTIGGSAPTHITCTFVKANEQYNLHNITVRFKPEDRDKILEAFLWSYGPESKYHLTQDAVHWENDLSYIFLTSPKWINGKAQILRYKKSKNEQSSYFLLSLRPAPRGRAIPPK